MVSVVCCCCGGGGGDGDGWGGGGVVVVVVVVLVAVCLKLFLRVLAFSHVELCNEFSSCFFVTLKLHFVFFFHIII